MIRSATHPSYRAPFHRAAPRSAFTLVELLIVITILAILASLLLFALAGAQTTAIEMRTRSTIVKLHNLLMPKYDSYRTRRLPLTTFLDEPDDGKGGYVDLNGNGSGPDHYTPAVIAQFRLDALRDYMRMEMPDGFEDVEDLPITKTVIKGTTVIPRPAINQTYLNILTAAKGRNSTVYGNTKLQQAMCLYLIVTKGLGDPDVLEQFATNEIKTDPDLGLSYFVDGWGNPIYWLRWAPGFYSPLQPDPTAPGVDQPKHDQFDPLNIYPVTTNVALYPLIYSAGPDGKYEVEAGQIKYGDPPPAGANNDPYWSIAHPPSGGGAIGSWKDQDSDGNDGRIDNITNHDIETR